MRQFRSLATLAVLAAATVMFAASSVQASTLSTDMLADEASAGDSGSFGPWRLGGYNTTDPFAASPAFTQYTAAQHLDNGLAVYVGNFPTGPYQGYGYNNNIGVPAILINTTNASQNVCCGISPYAPGEIFVHSWDTSIDANRQEQVVRYVSPGLGTVDINALFTQKHSGGVPYSVRLDGLLLPSLGLPTGVGFTAGQNSSYNYLNPLVAVLPGSTIDFVLAGQASAAIDVTINFTPVPEPSTVVLLGLGMVGMVAYRRRQRIA